MGFLDFSLAHTNYAHIHEDYGGPLQEISCRESIFFNEPAFEAFAYLKPAIIKPNLEETVIYGSCNGSGTSKKRDQAIYAAISESLERWAWHDSHLDSSLAESLGLNIDPSTTGFAAFPSMFYGAAKNRALAEAVERWSIKSWWEEKLNHELLSIPVSYEGVNGIRLRTPFHGFFTVLLWKNTDRFVTYGFASSKNLTQSIWKASVELQRNVQVLSSFFAGPSDAVPTNINERRLLYFSKDNGYQEFLNRLGKTVHLRASKPKLVVDRAVNGPWDKYTKVWRCLLDPQDLLINNNNENYFLF